MTRRI